MTFSIAGICQKTGMTGVAVTTSSIAVGSRCPWVKAKVGAVSTQNVTLPEIGPLTLEQMQKGLSAQQALDKVIGASQFSEYRQVIAIGLDGSKGSFSGSKVLGTHAIYEGKDAIAAGNLLRSDALPQGMVTYFDEHPELPLAERLIAALQHGLNEFGGEEGPVHSAAVLIADQQSWPMVDLRVDWDDNAPLDQLMKLWVDYEPQMQAYVDRAINPPVAPSYGVPGDE